MREIPLGWIRELDGSYSPPKTARQHNCASGVGEVILDTGSSLAGQTSPENASVVAKPARVEFKRLASKDEDGLNRTERAFLAILRAKYDHVRIQSITLKLADRATYTPDFSAVIDGRFTFFEVKGGFIREDGWLKLKIASRLYPEFDFVMAQYKNKVWTEKKINI